MSRAKLEDNKIIVSKDQFESSLTGEGGCSGSSLAGEKVLKKGPWTSLEDAILVDYVEKHGKGNWNAIRKLTGLSRCGKSCRLRWANHLRPDLKKGAFTHEEEKMIIYLHSKLGNKWAQMAACIPGRTDNEIKNYWNTRAKKQHRAGLPLYPQHALLEAANGNLQALNTKLSSTGLQSRGLEPPAHSFNPGSHGGMAGGKTMFEQLPHGPGSANKNLPSLCYSKPGGLVRPNGNFSTSSPITGAAESELPSLQYPQTLYCRRPTCPPAPPYEAIHTYVHSPLATVSAAQSDCAASPSSGLLDTLVQESRAISSVRKQSSERRSNYSAISSGDMPENSTANMCGAEWEGSSDLNSPFCRSAVSPFNNSSLDELPDLKGALGLEMAELGTEQICAPNAIEKDISDWLDVLKGPDALLGSGW